MVRRWNPSNPMPFNWTINPYSGCSHACTFCFARNTHTCLDLDSGKDFDREIIVKTHVAAVLTRELARPGWNLEPDAFGTNTDPYQRGAGRYRLLPGIIASLADSEAPFSVLTKRTLLRRDLSLLAQAKRHVVVDITMTIAVHDDDLQKSVEPGAPATLGRLDTVRGVRENWLDCTVFMMPILPYLTDTKDHLERALEQLLVAGATSVMYSALHLRQGARQWFMQWLESNHPGLVDRYRACTRRVRMRRRSTGAGSRRRSSRSFVAMACTVARSTRRPRFPGLRRNVP